ncbi:MAG TPA: response regulator, partial [Planctomycetes bacterium]|nr:response regulator [Planctomycetota bacterium]
EDDANVRTFIRDVLGGAGYGVVEALSGTEAAAICAGTDRRIDLVLTDVVLPGMSGKELAAMIERKHPGIAVLFMSGYTDNAIVHHGVLDPGVAFIEKPFSPDALLLKVHEMLERHGEEARG